MLYLSIEKLRKTGKISYTLGSRVGLYDRLESGRALNIRIDTWPRNSLLHILPRK